MELREERWAKPERREADAEGEERVRRKETDGEESEDFAGKTLEDGEDMRVVEEARDAIDDTHFVTLYLSNKRLIYLSITSLCRGSMRWR